MLRTKTKDKEKMNNRQRMRYSNKLIVKWLLDNVAVIVWLRTHSRKKDFHYTKESTTANHDVFGLFDGAFIDYFGNLVWIQNKTNSWPPEKPIIEFLERKNIHAMALNARLNGKGWEVLHRCYNYYIPS